MIITAVHIARRLEHDLWKTPIIARKIYARGQCLSGA
jgi:hypothetical protein